MEKLRVEDTAAYKEMLRMNCETFEQILTAIGPEITKHQVVGGHRVISPAARLILTLRFLATGETFRSLHFQFRMFVRYVEQFIQFSEPDTCQPLTSCPEWLQIAEDFERMWTELYRSNRWETCRNLPSKWKWIILL